MLEALAQVVGCPVSCSKTVGKSDIYLSPNHVAEAATSKTAYGHRIAHGALLIGYMPRASTLISTSTASSVLVPLL